MNKKLYIYVVVCNIATYKMFNKSFTVMNYTEKYWQQLNTNKTIVLYGYFRSCNDSHLAAYK